MKMFNTKSIFLTGGTGSFGHFFTNFLIKNSKFKKLTIFSRDEMKQWEMKNVINDNRVNFIIGDVRDDERLLYASKNSDLIVHAAATKIVPTAEEFPTECIKTNVLGAINVIKAAKRNKISKVIALSTDKACNPINLYGATKLTSDKLFISSNEYTKGSTKFAVVRYGNVINSRGSVIPFFKSFHKNQKIPITNTEMTRFMITLKDAIELVFLTYQKMLGGEIFVKKCPSIKVIDIAKAINKNVKFKIIGIRPGEKIHEEMINVNDARNTYEFKNYYKLLPEIKNLKILDKMRKGGKKTKNNFSYISNLNTNWMEIKNLQKIIKDTNEN